MQCVHGCMRNWMHLKNWTNVLHSTVCSTPSLRATKQAIRSLQKQSSVSHKKKKKNSKHIPPYEELNKMMWSITKQILKQSRLIPKADFWSQLSLSSSFSLKRQLILLKSTRKAGDVCPACCMDGDHPAQVESRAGLERRQQFTESSAPFCFPLLLSEYLQQEETEREKLQREREMLRRGGAGWIPAGTWSEFKYSSFLYLSTSLFPSLSFHTAS